MQATQMRAALAFDTHKLNASDAAAYETFRQTASAFRAWRKTAEHVKLEANHFRAAVSRWLMAVGHWESHFLAKVLAHWRELPRQLADAGARIAARDRLSTLRRHLRAMSDACQTSSHARSLAARAKPPAIRSARVPRGRRSFLPHAAIYKVSKDILRVGDVHAVTSHQEKCCHHFAALSAWCSSYILRRPTQLGARAPSASSSARSSAGASGLFGYERHFDRR